MTELEKTREAAFVARTLPKLKQWSDEARSEVLVLPMPISFGVSWFEMLQRFSRKHGYDATLTQRAQCRCGNANSWLNQWLPICRCSVEDWVEFRHYDPVTAEAALRKQKQEKDKSIAAKCSPTDTTGK